MRKGYITKGNKPMYTDLKVTDIYHKSRNTKIAKVTYIDGDVFKELTVNLKPGEGEKEALIFADEYLSYLEKLKSETV
jgi:hypothetical protein